MNYAKHYKMLIDRAVVKNLCAGEKHHIVPKCLGGSDDEKNLVVLSPREHFFAHLLLMKMNPCIRGLSFAVVMMAGNASRKIRTSNQYSWARKLASKHRSVLQKGKPRPRSATEGMSSALRGKSRSDEFKEKIAAANRGKILSLETRAKISKANKGRIVSLESRAKMSAARIGVPIPALLGNKSRTGMKNSAETRKKISDSNRGKKHTPQWCSNISLGSSKLPEDLIRTIRDEYSNGESQNGIAKKYHIGQSHISRIVRREAYSLVN